MNIKTLSQLCGLVLLVCFSHSASASTITTYIPTAGIDNTAGGLSAFSATDITKVGLSDDVRIQSNAGWPNTGSYDEDRYIEFIFTPNIPVDAVIENVTLSHEFRRSGALDNAKMEVWDGTGFVDQTATLGSSGTDHTDTIDITGVIHTALNVNSFKARFLAYRGGTATTTTSHDSVLLSVTYSTPTINLSPIGDDQTLNDSVDTPIVITLTATDPESNPLTYTIIDTPTKGTLSTLSDNQITYTPVGGLGDDSFTWKANDGVNDSGTSTVHITLTHGLITKLSLTANPTTLLQSASSTLSIIGQDQFGNTTTADNTTIVTLTPGINGHVADSTVTLVSGLAASVATASAAGAIEFIASSGSLTASSVTITFEPLPVTIEPTPPPVVNGGVVLIPQSSTVVTQAAPIEHIQPTESLVTQTNIILEIAQPRSIASTSMEIPPIETEEPQTIIEPETEAPTEVAVPLTAAAAHTPAGNSKKAFIVALLALLGLISTGIYLYRTR